MLRSLASLALLLVVTLTFAADWPQWRGPDRTGISKDTGLLKEWPKDGPALRWKITDLGSGYSSPSVSRGKVYIQTNRKEEEFLVALDEKTGKQVWISGLGKVGKNKGPQYPGTRSTPTVDGDHVYGLASDGELVCFDLAGKSIWQKNLARDFEGKMGMWAYSESVLVDGDLVICTPGGSKATLAALDKKSGKTIWEAAVPGGDIADYASIMPVEACGRKQYVQFLRKGVVGVDARTGKFLWRYDRSIDPGANILTPVIQGNKVYTAGSRSGGGLVELTVADDGVTAREVYFEKGIAPSIGGAVLLDGHLYGSTGQTLFCTEFATGKEKWKNRSVGPASVCIADGRIYARGYNTGEVALVEATPKEYRELGKFKQPFRSKIQAWPHPVVANGGFYLRDQDTLLCYDVQGK